MSDRETTAWLMECLRASNEGKIQIEEMPFYQESWIARRADLVTINPSSPHELVGYEVKASRADLRRDTKKKQARCVSAVNRFYYVTPDEPWGDLIPGWAGWQVIRKGKQSYAPYSIITRRPSPKMDADPPSWRMVVGALRNSSSCRRDVAAMKAEITDLRNAYRSAKSRADNLERCHLESLAGIQ